MKAALIIIGIIAILGVIGAVWKPNKPEYKAVGHIKFPDGREITTAVIATDDSNAIRAAAVHQVGKRAQPMKVIFFFKDRAHVPDMLDSYDWDQAMDSCFARKPFAGYWSYDKLNIEEKPGHGI